MADLRRRLRDKDPIHLLGFLSAVVEVSDGRPGVDGTPTDITPLVESFIGVDLAETTAALHALQVLVTDTDVVSAIRAELGRRRQPMPLWLKGIGDTRVSGAAMMGTGPGDNILLGVDWDGGGSTTYVVYVDHTRGTVVRDAFPVPLTLDAAITQFEEIAAGSGDALELEALDLADARALVEEALSHGDDGIDPESDSWPASRPILAWLLSTMPEDLELAVARQTRELVDAHADIVEAFIGSPEAKRAKVDIDSPVDHQALMLIAGFGGMATGASLMQWTPDRVDEFLTYSLPTSVLVDEAIARRLPAMFKAFVRWGSRETGGPKELGPQLTRAVDRAGKRYVTLMTAPETAALSEAIRGYRRVTGIDEIVMPVVTSDPHD
jgi:hypothetical protein